MSRSQRMLVAVAGVIGVLLCLALTVYYATGAPGHPRGKHMILFIALAVVSALVSWFAYPSGAARDRL